MRLHRLATWTRHSRDARSSLRIQDSSLQNLPGTAERVETHVSRRKQRAAHGATRDRSRLAFVPRERQSPDRRRPPSAFREPPLALTHEALTAAKYGSFFAPNPVRRRPARPRSVPSVRRRTSGIHTLIGTPKRLETRVSHRKQNTGHPSNRYSSDLAACPLGISPALWRLAELAALAPVVSRTSRLARRLGRFSSEVFPSAESCRECDADVSHATRWWVFRPIERLQARVYDSGVAALGPHQRHAAAGKIGKKRSFSMALSAKQRTRRVSRKSDRARGASFSAAGKKTAKT